MTRNETIKNLLISIFSITTIKDILYTISWYLLNHSYGIIKCKKGKNVKIRPFVMLRDPERIFIGDNSSIGIHNVLWAGKKDGVIRIGKNVMTGPSVKIFAFNHGMEMIDLPMIDQHEIDQDVIIEEDVWIGANVLIMPGSIIGKGSVIAAGSVVTTIIPPYSICAGIPAKIIKER